MMISDCNHLICKIANDIFNDLFKFLDFLEMLNLNYLNLRRLSLLVFSLLLVLEEKGFTTDMIEQFKKFINLNDNENIFNMIKEHIKDDYNTIIMNEYNELSEEDKKYCDNFMDDFKLKFDELKSNDVIVEFNTKLVDKIFTSTDEKFKLYINTKYNITSPFLNHDIEIFRNKNSDPFSLIVSFI